MNCRSAHQMEVDRKQRWPSYTHYKFDTAKDAAEAGLKSRLDGYVGFALQFWFKNECDYTGDWSELYVCHEFMDVVAAHPGVVELAEYVNPNSGNKIKGYMILNQLSQAPHENDED